MGLAAFNARRRAEQEAKEAAAKTEGQGGEKPLGRMNNAELDAKASELALVFPESVKTKTEKAAFIAEQLAAKAEDQTGDKPEGTA